EEQREHEPEREGERQREDVQEPVRVERRRDEPEEEPGAQTFSGRQSPQREQERRERHEGQLGRAEGRQREPGEPGRERDERRSREERARPARVFVVGRHASSRSDYTRVAVEFTRQTLARSGTSERPRSSVVASKIAFSVQAKRRRAMSVFWISL